MSAPLANAAAHGLPRVEGVMNFIRPMPVRPRYHANDMSRDVLDLEPHAVSIEDVRGRATPPSLEQEGFVLCPHASAVRDFRDADEVGRTYAAEIRALLLRLTGATEVVMNPRGILRFSERSADCGMLDNSRPARFVHVDVSDTTARAFAEQSAPPGMSGFARAVHYNAWRVLTAPPQDVPLALCEARSLGPGDTVPADAIFDAPGQPEWSFEGLVIRYSAAQRWVYYSDMRPDEVLLFVTHDSSPGQPHQVAHSAFTDPRCPPDTSPRVSIEMRGIAYWRAEGAGGAG